MTALLPDGLMPEGFFANTQEIYAEVASYPVVPPEKIRQYWNVYTTTFRRLFDPSAYRLENFWWHVWGSDKRNMSGPALAKLFEEFSNGPTYALLWPPEEHRKIQKTPGSSQRDKPEVAQGPGQEPTLTGGAPKPPTPSSSRPPPPHPILKKSRTPSTSVRRPTARFASPPATSSDEVVGEGDSSSSDAAVVSSEMPPPPLPLVRQKKTTTFAVTEPTADATHPSNSVEAKPAPVLAPDMPPPPVSSAKPSKGATAGNRKIVVTTAASRRKPVIVRRRSSQSSTGSNTDARTTGPASTAAPKAAKGKRKPLTAEQLLGQGSISPQASEPVLSAKAAGKRPAKTPMAPPGVAPQSDGHTSEPVAAHQPQGAGPQRRSTWDVRGSAACSEPVQSRQEAVNQSSPAPPPVAGFVAGGFGGGAPAMIRSRSNNTEGSRRFREPGLALLPSQATSSVATFITTARGQFDSEPVTAEPVVPEARDIPDNVRFGSQPSSSPLLDPHFTPTPPNPAPPILFGRSKSELTLLLEREKERTRSSDGS